MNFLVTGAAGFIGASVAQRLCDAGHHVVGLDNLNDYYEVSLKQARLAKLNDNQGFVFEKLDLADRDGMADLFRRYQFDRVIHLAAQAGVRYSLDNPMAYSDSNLTGFLTILEGCRQQQVDHLVYASSSSVYGMNKQVPFKTEDAVDHPVSLYAATKKANELMAHTYSHLYNIPTTGLRFFTVYGPWGRPDMALFKFTRAILDGEPIDIYNNGDLSRDFTYIDDIVEGVLRVQAYKPEACKALDDKNPATSTAPFRLYNIGNGQPVKLMDFVSALEKALGKTAEKRFLPMQPGDVYQTWADTEDLFEAVGYRPQMDVNTGVKHFIDWYRDYYRA